MHLLERLFMRVYFLMKLTSLLFVLSLYGGVFFGFVPASATLLFLYKVNGQDIEGYRLTSAFSYFKKQFVQANLVAALLLSVGLIVIYTIWFSIQLLPSLWIILALVSQFSLLIYVVSMYGLYLKLQVYYEFSAVVGLKLIASSLFLNGFALFKWWLGTGLCLFFAWKFPLVLAVFLPVVWLLFTFDSLDPIYQQIEERRHL